MAIDIEKIFSEYNVEFKNSGEQVTRGWVNVQCPFCDDVKYHLGYNAKIDLFTCWKCGIKNKQWALSKILKINFSQTQKIIDENFLVGSKKNQQQIQYNNKKVELPNHFRSLKTEHKKYLKSRNFNPNKLSRDWGLIGSDDSNYRDMILIPIYFKGRLVSYHSRSIIENNKWRVKACPNNKEVINHKEILYGFDQVVGNTVIVVEGPTDVWRFGFGAVATFGIKFTESQIDLLSCFKNIFIIFDSGEKEKQSEKQAIVLSDKLSIFNNVWVINDLKSDPGDLSQKKADKIKTKLFKIASKTI